MSEFKIGDRVFFNSDYLGADSSILFEIIDTRMVKQEVEYKLKYIDYETTTNIWTPGSTIKMDIKYYRDKQINELLDEKY